MKKRLLSAILSLCLLLSLCPTAMAYGTVSNGLSASTTEVSVGDEFGVELKIPAISDPLATIEFNISFPKDAFEVVTYEKPAFATMYSSVSDANSMGRITCSDFSASGDNDLTTLQAGGTISATLKVKDTAKAGRAYKIEVTLYTVDKIDEGTYNSVDCAPAGVVKTVTITVKGNTPAHEHVWSDAWSKDATHHWHDCTATGCDVTVNADKNGYAAHNYNQKVATKDYLKTAANCTDAAVYFYSCECGAKGTETFTEGTALGHTPSTEWSKDTTYHWHVCQTCNAELDKAAHNPGPAATETTPQTCTVCGYEIAPVLPHEHDYTEQVATDEHKASSATCTAKATYYYSCKCGANGTKTFESGNALGHSWGQDTSIQYIAKNATCTEDAEYYVTCQRCHEIDRTKTFTAADTALGHVQASPWNHNADEHWQVCTRCSKDFHKAAHNGGTATCKEKAKCEICGAEYGNLSEHNVDTTKWVSNSTQHFHKCLTKGCDYIKDAADHSGGKATCKEKAKCDVCAAEYGNLGAHTLTKTAAKAPTCLEPGNNEYYTCSVCGKVFKDAAGTTETTVAAETLAKSTTHVVESKYATSATEHWQICKVCGTVVGKAAHKFGEADANGRKTCADCGYTVGGTGTEGHKHAAGNTICYDENNHWNKCTDDNCDAHVNESAHKFGPKNTVTEGNKTITIETCSECGYVKRTETTTGGTTPVNPGGNKPTKPGTKDNGKTVQSGKTFDAGVGVYVGLSILSLTGSAVVIGKKRKTR